MPPRSRRRKPASTIQQDRIASRNRGQNKKPPRVQASNPPTLRATRPSRRAGASSGYFQPPEGDPESILRKSRKTRSEAARTGKAGLRHIAPEPDSPDSQGLEAQSRATKDSSQPALPEDFSDQQLSQSSDAEDQEEAFNRAWGYLPPFDEETAAVIEAIIDNPVMVKCAHRISPDKDDFIQGLIYRNVPMEPSSHSDPCSTAIQTYEFTVELTESEDDKRSQGKLWELDRENCDKGSNEALFQRTLMMGLIGRNFLIYKSDITQNACLDFSVEEVWTCPPMPTRAYMLKQRYLTQPKPDLAVCFRREAVIPNDLWIRMPNSMLKLVCFENNGPRGQSKVFHFFTIEAKRELTSINDTIAQRQCLNNASQSLFNLFEFFRDADHEEIFFNQVRVFSAVTSTEGLLIRIHRAEKVRTDAERVVPDYPLCFTFRVYTVLRKSEFERGKVLNVIERIIFGYGVKKLQPLLQQAAESIKKRYPSGSQEMIARADSNFYRYGQTKVGSESRAVTPGSTSTIRQRVQGVSTSSKTNESDQTMPPPRIPSSSVGGSDAEPSSAQRGSHPPAKTPSASKKRTRESQAGEARRAGLRRRRSEANN